MPGARMRTIDAAHAQLHHDDPQCAVTRYALRQLVKQGRVPCVMVGAKYLLNYDGLLAALAGDVPPEPVGGTSGIRRIAL